MANVTLTAAECRRKELPGVCVQCGADADGGATHTFWSYPTWSLLMVFHSIVRTALHAFDSTHSMTVRLPVCNRHRNLWKNRTRCVWISAAACLAVFPTGLGIGELTGAGADFMMYLCIGTLFLPFAWLAVVIGFHVTVVKATKITRDDISLTQVHRDFADALNAMREGAKEANRPEEWVWDENGPRKLNFVWDEDGPRRQRTSNETGPRGDE